MKNKFYTAKNIQERAKSIKMEAENYCPANNICYHPEKSALIVIDMQNVFLEEGQSSFIPSAPAIIPYVKQLCENFILKDRPVIFTRHINTEKNAKMMSRWWKSIIVEDNKSSQLTNKLDYSKGILIKKHQYDAFLETDLESILIKQDVSQLVICGVMTHLCCDTTTRSAFMKGFELFFTVDGTATYNEQMHRGTIINLAHGFAKPVLVNEILSELDNYDVIK
ncbi:MAG: cysteine hydrolase [PVC group bacterium]|nr:cysteine hydrolase [PVC group bacterium]